MGRARTLIGISLFWVPLSMLGDGFAALLVPVRVAALAEPAVAASLIGIVTFVGLLAAALVQPLAGAISDALRPRWGRRGPLVLAVVAVLLSLAAFGAVDNLGGVLVAFVLLMLAASVAQAAQQGFIPDLVPPAQRGLAAGAKGLADLGGAFVGFLLLGSLLAGGVTPALVALAAVLVVGAVLTLVLVREPTLAAPAGGSGRTVLLQAYALDFRRHGRFVRVVVARFIFLLGVFAVGRFLLLLVAERLGIAPDDAAGVTGGLLAALALGSAIAAVPSGWLADRFGRRRVMVAGALLGAAGALLIGLASTIDAMMLSGLVLAVGSALFSAANWAASADLAPPAEAARFMAIANFGTAGAAAAAGLFGPFADVARAVLPTLGYGIVPLAATVALLASALVAFSLRDTVAPTVEPLFAESEVTL